MAYQARNRGKTYNHVSWTGRHWYTTGTAVLEVMHGKPMDDPSNKIRSQESLEDYERRINAGLETSTIEVDLSTEIISMELGAQRSMTMNELEKRLTANKAEERHSRSIVAFEGIKTDTGDGSSSFRTLRLYVPSGTEDSGSTV